MAKKKLAPDQLDLGERVEIDTPDGTRFIWARRPGANPERVNNGCMINRVGGSDD